jgi:hypothetical protein
VKRKFQDNKTPYERAQRAVDVRADASPALDEEFLPERLRRRPTEPLNKRSGRNPTRRLRAMGIRDTAIAPASRWQNGFAEPLIESIRRVSLNHVIVLGEARLRRILRNYAGLIAIVLECIGLCKRMRRSLVHFSDPAP